MPGVSFCSDLLADIVDELCAALLTDLTLKYSVETGIIDARDLAACVVSEVALDDRFAARCREYARSHARRIRNELQCVRGDTTVSTAFSYLYAAKIMLAISISERVRCEDVERLVQRAAELDIRIPVVSEIVASDDARECVLAIAEFARRYRETLP